MDAHLKPPKKFCLAKIIKAMKSCEMFNSFSVLIASLWMSWLSPSIGEHSNLLCQAGAKKQVAKSNFLKNQRNIYQGSLLPGKRITPTTVVQNFYNE